MSDMLNDPEMRDIVEDFCAESIQLLDEAEEALDVVESDPTQKEAFEKFGLLIDRIMGTAKSIGADKIGSITEFCKVIGYKSSQNEAEEMNEIIAGVLLDTVDLLRAMIEDILNNTQKAQSMNVESIKKRLTLISGKLAHIKRASVALDKKEEASEDFDIDDIFGDLAS